MFKFCGLTTVISTVHCNLLDAKHSTESLIQMDQSKLNLDEEAAKKLKEKADLIGNAISLNSENVFNEEIFKEVKELAIKNAEDVKAALSEYYKLRQGYAGIEFFFEQLSIRFRTVKECRFQLRGLNKDDEIKTLLQLSMPQLIQVGEIIIRQAIIGATSNGLEGVVNQYDVRAVFAAIDKDIPKSEVWTGELVHDIRRWWEKSAEALANLEIKAFLEETTLSPDDVPVWPKSLPKSNSLPKPLKKLNSEEILPKPLEELNSEEILSIKLYLQWEKKLNLLKNIQQNDHKAMLQEYKDIKARWLQLEDLKNDMQQNALKELMRQKEAQDELKAAKREKEAAEKAEAYNAVMANMAKMVNAKKKDRRGDKAAAWKAAKAAATADEN